MINQCQYCGNDYNGKSISIKRGVSRFCSTKCYGKSRTVNATIRFWSKVNKTENGCWNWMGGHHNFGHGVFYNGEKYQSTHRFSYELHYGEIPKGLFVCHHCDNPKCIRPDHLFIGTQKENILDAVNKGRMATGDRHSSITHPEKMPKGETHGMAKLNVQQVKEIRSLSGVLPQRKIANDYSISQTQVKDIIHHKSWSHII